LTAANLKAEIHSSISFLELAAKHTCWKGVNTCGGGRGRKEYI
jgi:hypothetical protein